MRVIMLTGIGFNMNLFVGTLAFEKNLIKTTRTGVLIRSFISATAGYIILSIFTRKIK